VVESKPDETDVVISAYVEASRATPAKIAGLRAALHGQSARLSMRALRREDWAESWKRHFKPLEIGRELLIRPSWSKRKPRPGQELVVLDPGLSFGTGQHHTTRFCLDRLARLRHADERQSLLDIGTGSGILAIAAARLGYAPVCAIDNDPQAVRIARQNAARNRVREKIRLVAGDLAQGFRFDDRAFDVVCANLIATLLIAERRRIAKAVRRGSGLLIAAGILKKEFGEVAEAFGGIGLRVVETGQEREWKSAVFGWRQ